MSWLYLVNHSQTYKESMLTDELTDDQVMSVFRDWDECAAYEAERDSLTKSQACGEALCTFYSFDAPRGFRWEQTTAPEILELVTRFPWRMVYVDVLREEGVEMPEILQGIEFIRAVNEEASSWAQKIQKAAALDGDQVAWGMPELMRRRLESPFLFGKICLEIERHQNEVQSVKAFIESEPMV